MIERIKTNSVNSKNSLGQAGKNTPNQPQFKGGPLDLAVSAIQLCEANPMLNVAVLDLSTAIIPRTVVESETNPYAGFEAFRRESSGLIINCMIPGLIVAGIAKGLQKGIMGGDTKMADCWANEETINMVKGFWDKSKGINKRAKIEDTISRVLYNIEGIDGVAKNGKLSIVDFNAKKHIFSKRYKFDESIKLIADEVEKLSQEKPKGFFARLKYNKESKNNIKKAYENIVKQTHVSENIKIKGLLDEHGRPKTRDLSQGVKDIVQSFPRLLDELSSGKYSSSGDFAKRASKLVTSKSLLGLGLVIPLALSAQPFNRWLTEKMSGQKGAPIYKDFGQTQTKEKTTSEKAALFRQKIISASMMIGVALLSIGKKPDMKMAKGISQFKGIFPTMDQARIVSTATFVSRMMASEDKNDLREATVRDIATFSAFYFLGDYVAKGIATALQKTKKCKEKGIVLINELKELPKDANILKKFAHWAKGTALKTSDEVFGKTAEATKYAKKMRSVCQLGNLAFSLVALGLLIPRMNRKKTYKEREKELKEMGVDKNTIDKYYPAFAMNFAANSNKKVYNAFFTANPDKLIA